MILQKKKQNQRRENFYREGEKDGKEKSKKAMKENK